MKKALTLASVAAFAASAGFAATLNWNITAAQYAENGTTALANKTVALVMAASSATTAADIKYSYDAVNGWSIEGGTLVTVSSLNGDGKFTTANKITVGTGASGEWGTGKYQGTDFAGDAYTSATSQGTGSGNATKYFTIVFDTDYTSGNYSVLSPAVATTVGSPTITTAATTFTAATGASSTWSPVSVPEPTTVALLALGLAAVGLKRKVA